VCAPGREVRYAVFEESDCPAGPETFIELAKQASIEAFGEDRVSLIVRTRKGYHIYLDMWAPSYFEALLLSARFRNCLPCACREYKHVALATEYFMKTKWERFVLRVSPTKYVEDRFEIIYFREPEDACHRDFIRSVMSLYGGIYVGVVG